MSRSKVFASSQPAEQSALLSYLFETSFKNALKITEKFNLIKIRALTPKIQNKTDFIFKIV